MMKMNIYAKKDKDYDIPKIVIIRYNGGNGNRSDGSASSE